MRHITSQKKRRIDPDVENEIKALIFDNPDWTPGRVFTNLESDEAFRGRVSRRTVERMVKEQRAEDQSGPWGLSDSGGQDAGLILDVLRAVVLDGHIKKLEISRRQAEWVLKVRHIAPDMKAWTVWLLARFYGARAQNGETTDDLDAYLAFHPWRSVKDLHEYSKAILDGKIPLPPIRTRLEGIESASLMQLGEKYRVEYRLLETRTTESEQGSDSDERQPS